MMSYSNESFSHKRFAEYYVYSFVRDMFVHTGDITLLLTTPELHHGKKICEQMAEFGSIGLYTGGAKLCGAVVKVF